MNGKSFMNEPEFVATSVKVSAGQVVLTLLYGSTHSFPVSFYPRLTSASASQLDAVNLRVGGRALSWEDLDEGIWLADAIMARYPAALLPA